MIEVNLYSVVSEFESRWVLYLEAWACHSQVDVHDVGKLELPIPRLMFVMWEAGACHSQVDVHGVGSLSLLLLWVLGHPKISDRG